MATTPPFKYQPMFEKGKDTTEYYLLTKDYVSVSEFEGKPILKIEKEGLTAMANAAFRDVSFLLRRSHNEQVAKILSDPEASDNDKYVALTFLRNAEVSAKGKLPLCQDTGTAIIHGEKGQQVWTGYCDEEALSLGVYKTYTEENLRYSQNAPLTMYDEVNTKCNLPAQIDIEYGRYGVRVPLRNQGWWLCQQDLSLPGDKGYPQPRNIGSLPYLKNQDFGYGSLSSLSHRIRYRRYFCRKELVDCETGFHPLLR